MSFPRRTLTVAASVALAVSIASPADAERETFKDKRGEIRSGVDIRSVYAKNGGKWITVKTIHRKLKRHKEYVFDAYVDTVRDWKGPEFKMAGAAYGEYFLYQIWRWGDRSKRVKCKAVRFRINYKRDVVTYSVRRRCLARVYQHRVGRIRVGASAGLLEGRTDWAPRKHRLYPTVRRN